jgi:uncharacterized membrane protein (DUF2068 family)
MSDSTHSEDEDGEQSRLLPWIGGEHVVVAVILLTVGITLVTEAHTNVGNDITRLARRLGLDPSSNGIHGLLSSAKTLTPDKLRFYGIVAIAYGLLEGSEGYGLIRRRRWGEYLTVVATMLLFIPDIYQLVKEPSIFKLVLFLLNVVMITYLAVHLRRTREPHDDQPATAGNVGSRHQREPNPATST